jgi:hypothetical protein
MAEKPTVPKKRRAPAAATETQPLEALKEKYRLNATTYLRTKDKNDKPMGEGKLMDDAVFNKLANLDNTRTKVLLDWMLFQAGGGESAWNTSKQLWDNNEKEEKTGKELLDDLLGRFKKANTTIQLNDAELKDVAEKLMLRPNIDISEILNDPSDGRELKRLSGIDSVQERFATINKWLLTKGLDTEQAKVAARAITASKFQRWLRQAGDKLHIAVRDRAHCSTIYSAMAQGVPLEDAEIKWHEKYKDFRRREWMICSDDELKRGQFGYQRFWPGQNGIYETVYDAVKKFKSAIKLVEQQTSKIEGLNARIAEKNKALPPERQIALRQPPTINANIGKITVTKTGDLEYKGQYPTPHDLIKASEIPLSSSLQQRVAQDVQYAGQKGIRSNTAKIYSDDILNVSIPLTVAAAIESGRMWDIGNPEQIREIPSQGTYPETEWMKFASGAHEYAEWQQNQAVPIFFTVKNDKGEEEIKIMMVGFIDDMSDLTAPYNGTIWYTGPKRGRGTGHVTFSEMLRDVGTRPGMHNASLMRSFTKAMGAIREWGKEFNPKDIIGDYIAHHRERMHNRPSVIEKLRIRANQAIDALIND